MRLGADVAPEGWRRRWLHSAQMISFCSANRVVCPAWTYRSGRRCRGWTAPRSQASWPRRGGRTRCRCEWPSWKACRRTGSEAGPCGSAAGRKERGRVLLTKLFETIQDRAARNIKVLPTERMRRPDSDFLFLFGKNWSWGVSILKQLLNKKNFGVIINERVTHK